MTTTATGTTPDNTPPTTPPTPGNPLRTILLAVGSVLLIGVIGYLVIAVVVNANRTDASREIEFADSFDELTVNTEVADVIVEFADVEETTVAFRQNDSDRSYEFDAEIVGSTLEVRVIDHWAGFWLPFGEAQSPRLVVTMPDDLAGVDASVETGVGDVTLDGEFGAVLFASGVGDLRIDGSATRADLESGVGDITARGYSVEGDLVVESGTGDVTLGLASIPGRMDVNSGVGDQRVTVPAGSYRVETHIGVGEVSVGVDNDSDASTVLRFESGVGDIRVDN